MAVLTRRSLPHVSVVGDTFSSVGRVLRNISAGLALGASLTLASQLGGALAPAKAAVIVPTPLVYDFSLTQGDMAYGTYANFMHLKVADPTFRVDVVIDGATSSAASLFLEDDFGSWKSSTSALQGFWLTTEVQTSSLERKTLVFLDRGPLGSGDGVFTIHAVSRLGGNFELINPTVGDALIGFAQESSSYSSDADANRDGDNNENTGIWEYVGNGQGNYFGDPSGSYTLTVPIVNSSSGSASVPGPLPILGLAAAFGFSRKLRKRIKLHRGTSAVSIPPGA